MHHTDYINMKYIKHKMQEHSKPLTSVIHQSSRMTHKLYNNNEQIIAVQSKNISRSTPIQISMSEATWYGKQTKSEPNMFPIDYLKENVFFYFWYSATANTVLSITAKPAHITSVGNN